MNKGMSCRIVLISACLMGTAMLSKADTWSGIATADAFVAVGSGSNPAGANLTANNYGGAGTLAIASASSVKGEFQSLLKFNLSSAVTQFNNLYGSGQWQITSISLKLSSNFGDQGEQPNNNIFNTINTGGFTIAWLADDSWVEGSGNPGSPQPTGVNYNSLSSLVTGGTESTGSYTYNPPGDGIPITYSLGSGTSLVADVTAGGDVTLLFAPGTGNVGYLFNSKTFGSNSPTLIVSAIPEPGALSLLLGAGAVLGLVSLRRLRRA